MMNTFSAKAMLTGLRILLALVFAFSGQILAASRASAASPITILDTLGAATPATRFELPGSGGQALANSQQLGPQFVLTQATTITEIGTFVTYCELLSGVTQCPSIRPIMVQIRRSIDGQPDVSRVLGNFPLSFDRQSQVFSYQAAHPHLRLPAGTYFAIFKILDDGSAGLLSFASDPFLYQAGTANVGFIFQPDQHTGTGQLNLAFRILGEYAQQ